MPRRARIALTGIVAAGVGLAGAAIYIQLVPLYGLVGRVAAATALFLAGGAVVGLLNPRGRGWLLAGLNAWSSVLLGSIGLGVSLEGPRPGELPLALALLLLPAAVALTGGWLGARLRR